MLIIYEHCLPRPCPNSDPNMPHAALLICQASFLLQELPPPLHVKSIFHVLRHLRETQTWSCDSSDRKPLMISCCRRIDTSCLSSRPTSTPHLHGLRSSLLPSRLLFEAFPIYWVSTKHRSAPTPLLSHSYHLPYFRNFLYSYHDLSCVKMIYT